MSDEQEPRPDDAAPDEEDPDQERPDEEEAIAESLEHGADEVLPREPALPLNLEALSPDVAELLGNAAEALLGLAIQASETFAVGVESVSGQRASLEGVQASVTEAGALEQELAELPHMGFELQVGLPPADAQIAAAFVGLDDLGALLSTEMGAEQMADEEFAASQGETAAQAMRELLDLVSITLFSDQLAGVEATLAGHRVGQPEIALRLISDIAQGAALLRLDLELVLPSGDATRVTVVLPSSLLDRLAALLGVAPAAQAFDEDGGAHGSDEGDLDGLFDDLEDGPTPLRRAPNGAEAPGGLEADERGDGFGIDSNPDNVSPFRPAGTFGAATTGDDVDVHPVRFPPLTEQGTGGTGIPAQFDLIMDVAMRITVELGRSSLTVEEVLALGPGSVIELNKLAGEPVDILVNERLIARGEVVVVDENFGVRVTEIVSPRRRVHAMGVAQ